MQYKKPRMSCCDKKSRNSPTYCFDPPRRRMRNVTYIVLLRSGPSLILQAYRHVVVAFGAAEQSDMRSQRVMRNTSVLKLRTKLQPITLYTKISYIDSSDNG